MLDTTIERIYNTDEERKKTGLMEEIVSITAPNPDCEKTTERAVALTRILSPRRRYLFFLFPNDLLYHIDRLFLTLVIHPN